MSSVERELRRARLVTRSSLAGGGERLLEWDYGPPSPSAAAMSSWVAKQVR